MAHLIRLPPEILHAVFIHLTVLADDSANDTAWQDLLHCSFTCWVWNEIANEILYHQVYIGEDAASSKLLKTIAPMAHVKNTAANDEFPTTTRRQQLGSLIQVVNIEMDIEDEPYHSPHSILTFLTATPNVHTVTIRDNAGLIMDWKDISAKWQQLKSLSIAGDYNCGALAPLLVESVLDRLQYLSISADLGFYFRWTASVQPLENLEILSVEVFNKLSYDGLRRTLKRCRNTLHTLKISWNFPNPYGHSLSLSDLTIGLRKLKIFRLIVRAGVQFNICNFGNHLEHLDLKIDYTENDINGNALTEKAEKNTSDIKTLRISSSSSNLEAYIPMILEANKTSLESLWIDNIEDWKWTESLVAKNLQMIKLTVLIITGIQQTDYNILNLAHIFPNVEFLELSRLPVLDMTYWHHVKWITAENLHHFQHLKTIGNDTSEQIIDQNKGKYNIHDVLWGSYISVPDSF